MGSYTKYKWRLYADNDIESDIIAHLRQSRVDVLSVAEDPELRRQQDDRFHYQRARQLRRYLLTKDLDFWDDTKHPLAQSPGVLLISTSDIDVAKFLPLVLQRLFQDYLSTEEPFTLEGMKIKMGPEAFTMKGIDHDTQKVTSETYRWEELI